MDTDKVIGTAVRVLGWLVILVLLLMMLTCCGVSKPKVVVEYRDSVRVEYRDRIVRDTVRYEVEKEVEKIVTRDTVSHLENRWAKSDASVSGGFLSHSLSSIPRIIEIPVEHIVTDTLIVQKEAQISTQTKYVEKSLTWWQRFRMGAFWWLVAACIIGWRRELLALGKIIIKLFV